MHAFSRSAFAFLISAVMGAGWAAHSAAEPPARWRLLSETPAAPITFRVPIGVHDPLRQRMLVFESSIGNASTSPLELWSFEPAPAPRWRRVPVLGPAPPRPAVGAATYDSKRDRLLVTGFPAGGVATIWALDLSAPSAWQELRVTGSRLANLQAASATYDPVRDRLIIFGGQNGGTFDPDVWVVDLATLVCERKLPFDIGPEGRDGHSAIYDPAGRRLIVFGGHTENGGRRFLNDTWALSLDEPMRWTELSPQGDIPSARYAAGSVFDPIRGRLIVHGGLRADDTLEPDDVWALTLGDSPIWTALGAAQALRGRSFSVDFYEPATDRLVSCGGGDYAQASALPLTGTAPWTELLPIAPLTSPPARTGFEAVQDSRRQRIVVIGGQSTSIDSALWSFSPRTEQPWHAIRAGLPSFGGGFIGVPVRQTVYDSLGDRVIVFDGHQLASAPASRPTEWTALGPRLPEDAEIGRGAGIDIDTRRNRVILSGGWYFIPHSGSFTLRDVYALPLGGEQVWAKLGSLPHYIGSGDHSMFYDPLADRLLVTGGGGRPGRLGIFPNGGGVWSADLGSPTLAWVMRDSTLGTPGPDPLTNTTMDGSTGRLYAVWGNAVWSRSAYESGPWTPLAVEGVAPNVISRIEFDPVLGQIIALFASSPGSEDVQAWAIGVRPLQVELTQAVRTPQRVELEWQSARAYGEPCVVERREAPNDWGEAGTIEFDVRGLARYTDVDVQPEHDYAYRVRVGAGDSAYVSPASLVTTSDGLRVAILGARPNPAIGAPSLVFSLPGEGHAELELFDIGGRRCAIREVGALGAGRHTVSLVPDRALDPGVYFARLRRGPAQSVARVVIAR